jgi:predicted nicotinamide N-methyase
MSRRTPEEARTFIRANTRIRPVEDLPLSFWQADEITPIWTATEHDLEAARLAPPFWAFAWAGGQAIARWIYENPDIVRGKRTLDLACGCGVAAIAAAQCGAKKSLANDIDPMCEAATLLNAELNNVTVGWLGGDLIGSTPPGVDIILAGDVFYEKPMAEAFLAFLTRCKASGIDVIVGDPGRSYFPKGLSLLADYAIPTTMELESMLVKQTRVWRL